MEIGLQVIKDICRWDGYEMKMGERTIVVRAMCVRVLKGRAEETRRSLRAAGLLRGDLEPFRDGELVYLPITDGKYDGRMEVCRRDFKQRRAAPGNYREIAGVPAGLRRLLPRAFDIIGKVIVIKIPEELMEYRREIGHALMEARPGALSVARDLGVKGEDRIRELEVIAGSRQLETVHVEHGLKFRLDPSKVYFSPRLATERLRVARLVAAGEAVLDMFAGVGPFSIHIARRACPSVVYAADINPAAIEYLRMNLRLNRVSGVEPLLGDARGLPGRIPPVDRIIMNLPHSAFEFLPTALRLLRPGGTVHLYEILEPENKDPHGKVLARAVQGEGRRLLKAQGRLVRGYSSFESHFVFDLIVE